MKRGEQKMTAKEGKFMVNNTRPLAKIGVTAAFVCLAVTGAVAPARAEPVTDSMLSNYQLVTKNGCVVLKVNFNVRIQYISHFPVERGDQLSIIVRPIDPQIAAAGEGGTPRESLRPPENAAALQSITFEPRAAQGSVLSLGFKQPVVYNVASGQDFQSLIISLADGKHGQACAANDPLRSPGWETVVRSEEGVTVAARRRAGSNETVIQRREAARAGAPLSGWGAEEIEVPEAREDESGGIKEARAAMKQQDLPRAIKILKRVDGPEAMELLGVAYQKNKQSAEAKATYQGYLRRYGTDSGAEGVRQRLAGIETAEAAPGERLRGPSSGSDGSAPGGEYWSLSGSASEFYIRDDSFRTQRDPTQPINLNDEADDHRVHRNVMMSNLDAFAAWGNSQYKSKFRFAGAEEHGFDLDGEDIVSVAALYYDTTIRDWGTSARLGRQTQSGGGVLGRFDGAYASWQATPWMRVAAVGGSPVASRKDEPYKDEKYFYGTSLNFGPVLGGFDASLFAVEQRDQDIIDRQAVGGELRYADAQKSAFLTADYDTHYNELNAVIMTGSLTLPDKSTVRASADYRKAPYFSTWTAVQGQTYKSLYDLLKEHTLEEAEQMAADRSATYKSASVGYTRQLSDKLQVNLDATITDVEGTIASYGVDAMPSTGTEYYYSAQLVGNNLLTEDDLWTAGLRYSDLDATDNYAVDLSTRYAVTKDMRVTPRVLLEYHEGKKADLEEYSVLPSVLMDYMWMKDLNLELELGAKTTWRTEGVVESHDTEVFVTAGVRYDFYAGSDSSK